LKDYGNGEEYLLRRLKKHDAEHKTEFAAKWAAKLAKIAEQGNAKKSKAASGGKVGRAAAKQKSLDADHSEQRVKTGGRAVAREARAAEAHVSSSTMGCWDWRFTQSQRNF
jgi:hypothetical protein